MIKEYRKMRGYTQEELAELIDVGWRQLQRIEKDESKTKIGTLKKIIKVLKISDRDILMYMKGD